MTKAVRFQEIAVRNWFEVWGQLWQKTDATRARRGNGLPIPFELDETVTPVAVEQFGDRAMRVRSDRIVTEFRYVTVRGWFRALGQIWQKTSPTTAIRGNGLPIRFDSDRRVTVIYPETSANGAVTRIRM